MAMSMKFDLVKFLTDIGAQFNGEDDLEAYKEAVSEALRPFRIALASPETLRDVMDKMVAVTSRFNNEGRVHAPDGLNIEGLDPNPKAYIDWTGTTRENTGRIAQIDPIVIHQLMHQTLLRYFQTQFDAGGWEVDKKPDSPVTTVRLPGETWTFKVEMTKEILPH